VTTTASAPTPPDGPDEPDQPDVDGLRGFKPGDDPTRVLAYQDRWQSFFDLLAMVTIWLVVVPAATIARGDTGWYSFLLSLRLLLSAAYAVDIGIRTYLAPSHLYYLRHNLRSVATVVFPFLRVALSLRLLRSIFQRGNISQFVLAAGLMFLNLVLVVYFFERNAAHGNIKTLGESLWWGVVTVTTVGYGDYVPVTWQGRVAAVVLMGVGFATLATITAQISSNFIDQAARARATEAGGEDAEEQAREDQLAGISAQLTRLEQRLGDDAPPSAPA
jgi:voltage-gated potassium channel